MLFGKISLLLSIINFIAFLAIFSFTTPTFSQTKQVTPSPTNLKTTQKPILCGDPNQIFPDLQNNWNEVPLMRGQEGVISETGIPLVIPTYFFINPDTKTYTVIQAPPMASLKGYVCVIASGMIHEISVETLKRLSEIYRGPNT